jgi:hypothetical protein
MASSRDGGELVGVTRSLRQAGYDDSEPAAAGTPLQAAGEISARRSAAASRGGDAPAVKH